MPPKKAIKVEGNVEKSMSKNVKLAKKIESDLDSDASVEDVKKKTISKNIKSKITEESDSDDSNIEDIKMGPSDSEDEEETDTKDEEETHTKDIKKSKKNKLDYDEISSQIEELVSNIESLVNVNEELFNKLKENNKTIVKKCKDLRLHQKQIPKAFKNTKKNKTVEKDGDAKVYKYGINEKRVVPDKLISYLDLSDKDELYTRTEIKSLFSKKVRDIGLLVDKQIIITPDFAKHFNMKEIKSGDKFPANAHHSILKIIYDNC
jgi:hypothetical protein